MHLVATDLACCCALQMYFYFGAAKSDRAINMACPLEPKSGRAIAPALPIGSAANGRHYNVSCGNVINSDYAAKYSQKGNENNALL